MAFEMISQPLEGNVGCSLEAESRLDGDELDATFAERSRRTFKNVQIEPLNVDLQEINV